VLFCRWEIEHQVGFDECFEGFVVEDKFFVGVSIDVFHIKFGIEGWVYGQAWFLIVGAEEFEVF